MNDFEWQVRCGGHVTTGRADDIAHTVAALRHTLESLAAAGDAPEAEGSITDWKGAVYPFWMRWGSLDPAGAAGPLRHARRPRSHIHELVEGLRYELHRYADDDLVTAEHQIG